MRFENCQPANQIKRLLSLREQRHQEQFNKLLITPKIKDDDIPFRSFETFLQKDLPECFELFSKLAQKHDATEIFFIIDKNSTVSKFALQNILLILQDISQQKQKYSDVNKMNKFLAFANRLVLMEGRPSKYNHQSLQLETQNAIKNYIQFLQSLLKNTNSVQIVFSIINFCLQSKSYELVAQTQAMKELVNLFKPFRFEQDCSACQLKTISKLVSEIKEEKLLIFQLQIDKIFNDRCQQLVDHISCKLQNNAYPQLLKLWFKTLKTDQKSKFFKEFLNYSINQFEGQYYVFWQTKKIHNDLLNIEILLFMIENSSNTFFECLPQILGKIQGDKVICHLNQEIIVSLINANQRLSLLGAEALLKFSSLLQLLVNNQKALIKIIRMTNKKEQYKTDTYFYSIFQLFTSLFISNCQKDEDIIRLLPIQIYESILSKILNVMVIEMDKATRVINQGVIRSLINLHTFFTERETYNEYNDFSKDCVLKVMQILNLYRGTITNEKTLKKYFQLLNQLAHTCNQVSDKNEELMKLVSKFLECYYYKTQYSSIAKLSRGKSLPLLANPNTKQVLASYAKKQLQELQEQKQSEIFKKLSGNQLADKQKEIAAKIKNILPLLDFKHIESISYSFATIFAYYYQELPNIQQSNLYRIRNWICQFSTDQEQRRNRFIHIYQSIEKLYETLAPKFREWGYRIWNYPIQNLNNQEIKNSFKLLINNCYIMIRLLHLKTFSYNYKQNYLSNLIEFIFSLKCILHEAEHKSYDHLRKLTKKEIKNELRNRYRENIEKQYSVSAYSELFTVFKQLEFGLCFMVGSFKKKLCFDEQRYLFKFLGKFFKTIIQGQQTRTEEQISYYRVNQKIIKVGILVSILNEVMQKTKRNDINYFPCQQIYQTTSTDEQGFVALLKTDIPIFSCFYSEIQDAIIPLCKQLIKIKTSYLNTKKQQISQVEKGENPPRIYIKVQAEDAFINTLEQQYKQNSNWRKKSISQRVQQLDKYESVFTGQIQLLLNKMLLPNLRLSGACQFNYRFYEKGTIQMANGLLYQQICSILHQQDIDFLIDIKLNYLFRNYKDKVSQETNMRQERLKLQLLDLQIPFEEIEAVLRLCPQNTAEQIYDWYTKNKQIVEKSLNCEDQHSECDVALQNSKFILLSCDSYVHKVKQEIWGACCYWMENIKKKNQGWKIYQIIMNLMKQIKQDQQYKVDQLKLEISKEFFDWFSSLLIDNGYQTRKQIIEACKILNSQLFIKLFPTVLSDFYSQGIGYQILNFICSCQFKDREILIQTLLQSLLNHLPNMPEQSLQSFQKDIIQYISDICQVLQKTTFKAKEISTLLLAFSTIKKTQIIETNKKTFIKMLQLNRLDSGILTIYSLLNQDQLYEKAIIQHAIKSFIKQCLPKSKDGNHNFALKQISQYLQRFQTKPYFKQVCQKFLRRLDKDYIFFSEQQHELQFCETLTMKFIQYQPSVIQQKLIDNLIFQISNQQIRYEKSSLSPFNLLFDLLQAQKLLIPYFLTKTIKKLWLKGNQFREDVEIVYEPISWLIFRSCKEQTNQYFHLLQLVLLNNGLWTNKCQISDYTTAVLIKNLPIFRNESVYYTDKFRELAETWTMLSIYNFMKLKKFVDFFELDSNFNLLSFIKKKLQNKMAIQEQGLQIEDPAVLILADKILMMYMENHLIRELVKRKMYKINRQENQIDRQYLQMDLILSINKEYIQQQQGYESTRRDNNYSHQSSSTAKKIKPIILQPLQPTIALMQEQQTQQKHQFNSLQDIIKLIESVLPSNRLQESGNHLQKLQKIKINKFQIHRKNCKSLKENLKKLKSYKKGLRNTYTPQKIVYFNLTVQNFQKILSYSKQHQKIQSQVNSQSRRTVDLGSFFHRSDTLNRRNSNNTEYNETIWHSFYEQLPLIQDSHEKTQKTADQPKIIKQYKKRQILWNLGLPQNFLQQNNIKEEQFDVLNADQQLQLIQKICLNVSTEQVKEQMNKIPINLRVFPTAVRPSQVQKLRPRRQYEQTQKQIMPFRHPSIDQNCFMNLDAQIIRKMFKILYIWSPQNQITCFQHCLKNKKIQKQAIQIYLANLRKLKQGKKEVGQIVEQQQRSKLKVEETVVKWKVSHVSIKKIIQQILNVFSNVDNKNGMKFWDYLFEKTQSQQPIPDNQSLGTYKNIFIPVLQLTNIAFDYSPHVALKLLAQLQIVPNIFKEKLVELFKKKSFSQRQSFDNLDNLSKDQYMRKIFIEAFSEEKTPSIELLGKLIIYEFARVPYIKKLHEKALKDFKPEYYQFLNKVLLAYTKDELEKLSPFFQQNFKKYKQILQSFEKAGRDIKKQPISILKIQMNFSLNEKMAILRNHPQMCLQDNRIDIKINRDKIFEQSFQQIIKLDSKKLRGKLNITFITQQGQQPSIDAGGPTRQWFTLISDAFVNPQYKLFKPSQTNQCYTPDPLACQNKKALQMYISIGKIFGLAIRHKQIIGKSFTRAFYKHLLNIPILFEDLQQQDKELYNNLMNLNNINVTDFGLSYNYSVKGNQNQYFQRQLIPGGKNVVITQENKKDYINKYALIKMKGDMYLQVRHIIIGLNELVPIQLLQNFTVNDFQLLLSGVPKYTAQDLKKRVKYQGYTDDDQIIKWIWEILTQYTQEELFNFVQFITGKAHLSVTEQINITFVKFPNSQNVLSAHTCNNQLDLYEYESKNKLEQKMRIVIQFGFLGFAFG